MRAKAIWKKKGYGKFESAYELDRKGERIFVLTQDRPHGLKPHRIVFESFQAAKTSGWKKVI